ncbi:MAG: endo-1,4-beta-xylanase [Verrucomicrobiae bacterium]|nr:endo-1,4-beta-xylanase [Verrucomicrobiae bacterium]
MSMTRRDFLKAASAAAISIASYAGSAQTKKELLGDDEILAQCRARIERHRQSEGAIVLRDTAGKPVTHATIRVEQLRHEFRFGCNFFMFNRTGDPEREEKYRRQFAELFNFATLGFYWANYESEQRKPNYDYTDKVAEWCAQQSIICKGHPLVWDHPAASPRWLPEDDQQLEQLSAARVREIVARFKGRIDVWDVVNEPTHLPEDVNQTRMARWGKSLGPVDYVARHLRIAREANPAATLLVNDYRLEPAYLKILEDLRAQSPSLFDAVGIQSHMHDRVWPLRRIGEVCDLYAKLGLPIHFTETTILSGPRLGPGENWGATTPDGEQRQAEQTAACYTTLFAHPALQAITWWDFSDHGAWQRAPAGWLRRDMSPKPVYDRMKSLIRGEWWTKLEGRPDPSGILTMQAFHGHHRVTVGLPSGREITKEVHWQPGRQNRLEIEIS